MGKTNIFDVHVSQNNDTDFIKVIVRSLDHSEKTLSLHFYRKLIQIETETIKISSDRQATFKEELLGRDTAVVAINFASSDTLKKIIEDKLKEVYGDSVKIKVTEVIH